MMRARSKASVARNRPRRKPFSAVVATQLRPAQLAQLADAFAAAGVDARAADLHQAVGQWHSLKADTTDGEAAVAARRRELTARVAEGSIAPDRAAVELAKLEAKTATAPAAEQFAAAGRRQVLVDALRRLYDAGDVLVADELDPAVQAAVQAIEAAAPAAAGVVTDLDAVRASSEAHSAWAAMTAARDRVEACWQVARRLRLLYLTADFSGPAVPAEAWCWRNLEPVYAKVGRGVHPNWSLHAAIVAGARPGCLTAAEVADLHLDDRPPSSPGWAA